jgi:hypothetical protein
METPPVKASLSTSEPINEVDQTSEIPDSKQLGEDVASVPESREVSESGDSEMGESVDPFEALADEVTSWENQKVDSLTLFTPEKPNSWALDASTEKAMTPLTDIDIANLDYSSDDDYDSLWTYFEDLGIQASFETLRGHKVNLEMLHFLDDKELLFLGVSQKAVDIILASRNHKSQAMPPAAAADAADVERATNSSPPQSGPSAASGSGAAEHHPSPSPKKATGSGNKHAKPRDSPSRIPVLASRYRSPAAAKIKMSPPGQEHHSPPSGGGSSSSSSSSLLSSSSSLSASSPSSPSMSAAGLSPSHGRSLSSRIPVPASRRRATEVTGMIHATEAGANNRATVGHLNKRSGRFSTTSNWNWHGRDDSEPHASSGHGSGSGKKEKDEDEEEDEIW